MGIIPKTHLIWKEERVVWRFMEIRRPRVRPSDTNEDPPYETNGKVIPVMGASPKFMPILTQI